MTRGSAREPPYQRVKPNEEITQLTLQSIHLPALPDNLPLAAPATGLAYGDALALDVRSLFSPILRVEEEGWNGSGAAIVDVFCAQLKLCG